MKKIGIAIHGGAGTILKKNMTPEKEKLYKNGLKESILEGFNILKSGGSSLDAVEKAVEILENNPLFNAGKGSVFTHNKTIEMDASIMCGKTLNFGSISLIKNVKNPIKLAKKIMENCNHNYMVGKGAENLAKKYKLYFENDDYFHTQHRYKQLEIALKENKVQLDHINEGKGTVGAVAIDKSGNLAAATSTGGMTNKLSGRIGDSPIIGSGNYANNKTCAVSCTGKGESIMRMITAYDISCLMEYKGFNLSEACDYVLNKNKKINGEAGLIAIDSKGNIILKFNTKGMYRASLDSNDNLYIDIYK